MGRVWHTKVYIVPDAPHPFYHQIDAWNWCDDHHIPRKSIERYDSKGEYERWLELLAMQERGEISDLRRQVEYELIPVQTEKRYVGRKVIVVYNVEDKTFPMRRDALKWCRDKRIPQKYIVRWEDEVAVYKDFKVEDGVNYTADFVYTDTATGREIVEDAKSDYTRKERDYIIRRKLMLWVHHIKVKEYIYDRDRKKDSKSPKED